MQSIESVMTDDAKMKRLDQLFIDKGYTDKSTSIFKISMIQLPYNTALPYTVLFIGENSKIKT